MQWSQGFTDLPLRSDIPTNMLILDVKQPGRCGVCDAQTSHYYPEGKEYVCSSECLYSRENIGLLVPR